MGNRKISSKIPRCSLVPSKSGFQDVAWTTARKKWRIVGAWNRFTGRSGFAICSLDRRHSDICAGGEPIFTCYPPLPLVIRRIFMDINGISGRKRSRPAAPSSCVRGQYSYVLRYMKRAFFHKRREWYTCENEINSTYLCKKEPTAEARIFGSLSLNTLYVRIIILENCRIFYLI